MRYTRCMRAEDIFNRILNKRGEEDIIEGIVSGILILGLVVWIAGDTYGWGAVILWAFFIIAGIVGIAYLVRAASGSGEEKAKYNAKKQENAALALKVQNELKKRDEEAQEKEIQQRISSERKSYDAYKAAVRNSSYRDDLAETTSLIDKMFNDKDAERKEKILRFFNKYLPLITDSLEANKYAEKDISAMIARFAATVSNFHNRLYKPDETSEINKEVLKNLAIRDGLYDPYKNKLSAEEEEMQR